MGISGCEFARKSGLSSGYVSILKNGGKLILDPEDGKIDLEKSMAALATRERQYRPNPTKISATPPAETGDAGNPLEFQARAIVDNNAMLTHAAATTKKENYLAALRELEYDVATEKVIEVEKVLQAVAAEFAALRASILALPSKVAPRVIQMKSAEEARDFIEKEVRECLTALMYDERANKV